MSMKVPSIGLAVLLSAGCGSSQAALSPTVAATPCFSAGGASPFAHTDQEPTVAVPHDGQQVDLTVKVGGFFTIGWAGCDEHGVLSTESGASGSVTDSDISVYSSPRPVQSGSPCCQRPVGDGVFNVRYRAESPGRVVLRGKGSAGSDGTIAVTING